MKPELFLADLKRKPEALGNLIAQLREGNPWSLLDPVPERVVLLGMGSSMYAADVAAATEPSWRPEVERQLDGSAGCHLAAPARRLSSTQQSALMMREGPRRAAVVCESGDWAHVDVYVTKNTDYRLLSFASLG